MQRKRVVANIGCGPKGSSQLPRYFAGWDEVRIDADVRVAPDLVADLTNLSPLGDSAVDAVWASHCMEHLYLHQVPDALREFHRVLADHGFAVVLVPDLQAVARFFGEDRPLEALYQSGAGPISAHDMFYGHGKAIADGRETMGHRCGFTPSLLQAVARKTQFVEAQTWRRVQALDLLCVLRKTAPADDAERNRLVGELTA